MLLELIRQIKRRRTLVTFALCIALPTLIVVSIKLSGGPEGDRGADLVDVSSRSGLDAAFFVLQVTSGFLMVVVVALFAGDSIASEASWGSLRYLLVRPITRLRLLRVKLSVAALLGGSAIVLIPLVGLIGGTLAFGWKPLATPLGSSFSTGDGALRLLAADLYVLATLSVVLALAFLFSTLTDAPLAAVGGATITVVVSEILDAVRALGGVRNYLPTHYWFTWFDLLKTPVPTDQMARGLLSAIPWTLVPLLLAFWHFRRKDILS